MKRKAKLFSESALKRQECGFLSDVRIRLRVRLVTVFLRLCIRISWESLFNGDSLR